MNGPLVINKTDWPSGPWMSEPDEARWVESGFGCRVVRHRTIGSLCGYVTVPEEHPLYEVKFNRCSLDPGCGEVLCAHRPDMMLEVHGGLTYSGKSGDGWVFGFDCGHLHDYSNIVPLPGMAMWPRDPFDVYREFDYVERQVANLARQLVEITK